MKITICTYLWSNLQLSVLSVDIQLLSSIYTLEFLSCGSHRFCQISSVFHSGIQTCSHKTCLTTNWVEFTNHIYIAINVHSND